MQEQCRWCNFSIDIIKLEIRDSLNLARLGLGGQLISTLVVLTKLAFGSHCENVDVRF